MPKTRSNGDEGSPALPCVAQAGGQHALHQNSAAVYCMVKVCKKHPDALCRSAVSPERCLASMATEGTPCHEACESSEDAIRQGDLGDTACTWFCTKNMVSVASEISASFLAKPCQSYCTK